MTVQELQAVFSQNIKDGRTRLGLSQLKFAEKAELSVGYICDLESGRRWGTPETFTKLAAALGVEPFRLLMHLPDADADSANNADLCRKIVAAAELEEQLRKNLSEAVDAAVMKTFTNQSL